MKNKEILENVKLKISISNFVEEERREMRRINKNLFKVSAVACGIIVLVTGGVFAKDIGNMIKHLFMGASDGVITAVDNGYVSKVEGQTMKAQGVEINVDSFLIDDDNFAMNFKIKMDEESNIKDFVSIDIKDLQIIDENGEYVFNTHEARIENEKSYQGGYSFGFEKIGDNEYISKLVATGNPKKFPKSKHLSISFTKLETCKLVYENNMEQKERNVYEGLWSFEVDIPEEFYNRKTLQYKAISCTEKSIDINSITATLSNTAFKISIPKIKTDMVDYELLHIGENISDKIALQKEYVETTDGRKFEKAGRSDGDGGYSLPAEENTITDYHQTFNLTTYNATDKVKVYIFTNKCEEIIIEFEVIK